MQAYSTNHTAVFNDKEEEGSSDNSSNEKYEVNGNTDNDANESAEKEQDAGGGGYSVVDSDV